MQLKPAGLYTLFCHVAFAHVQTLSNTQVAQQKEVKHRLCCTISLTNTKDHNTEMHGVMGNHHKALQTYLITCTRIPANIDQQTPT